MTNCNTNRHSADCKGWEDRATWCVQLWLDNDPESYHHIREIARRYHHLHEAAAAIRGYVEDMNPTRDSATLYGDLMKYALETVNWRAIAEAFREN